MTLDALPSCCQHSRSCHVSSDARREERCYHWESYMTVDTERKEEEQVVIISCLSYQDWHLIHVLVSNLLSLVSVVTKETRSHVLSSAMSHFLTISDMHVRLSSESPTIERWDENLMHRKYHENRGKSLCLPLRISLLFHVGKRLFASLLGLPSLLVGYSAKEETQTTLSIAKKSSSNEKSTFVVCHHFAESKKT